MNCDTDKLVAVRTVYDRVYHVEREQLAGTKTLLRCYHADGRRQCCQVPGGNAAEWTQVLLHRENICPHDRETWLAHHWPDGTVTYHCPVCNPQEPDNALCPPRPSNTTKP